MFPRRRRAPASLSALLGVAVLAVFALGLWLGGHPSSLPGPLQSLFVSDQQRTFSQAIADVNGAYYRPISRTSLLDAGLNGMVASLHDPYSEYFGPAGLRQFENETNAQVSGIGVLVDPQHRGLFVIRSFPKSPARRAGLGHGDLIVAVNGRSLTGKPTGYANRLIQGKPGTQVRLTVVSRGRRRTMTLTRATVSIPVVSSSLRREPGGARVAVIALAQFSTGAHAALRSAVERRLHQGAQGIVLDLRRNPGGLVTEARLVASTFIEQGTIVTMRGRAVPDETLLATGDAISSKIPMVVLVDRGTASAAEIVTGALQDHGRATVVGTHTFGKGVFQSVLDLPNGGALKLTTGLYFTPKGHNLGGGGVREGAGIKPDVVARDNPRTRADEALRTALRVLAGKLAGR